MIDWFNHILGRRRYREANANLTSMINGNSNALPEALSTVSRGQRGSCLHSVYILCFFFIILIWFPTFPVVNSMVQSYFRTAE